QTIKQHDADFFIGTSGINITNDFSFNGFIGTGTFAFESEAVGLEGQNTVIPGLYTVLNTENQGSLYLYGQKKINSVYSNAEFDYQDKIFLTVSARNDWFSTLSAAGKETPNNDLYGSASLSVILSDLVELPSFISFAKLRGGYSQVAGGAGNPYALSLTYGLIGSGHLGSPLGAINGGNIPNKSITPFQKDETEIGFDLRMFKNRVSLDFAYYENITMGDIVNAATSVASGYNATTINLGEMTNKGVEILLRGTIIDKEDLSLDLSLNYANNQSNVVKTDENGSNLQIAVGSLFESFIGAIEGQPYGVIYGTSFQRDAQGRVIHKLIDGVPIAQKENVNKILGLGVAPTQLGFGGNLSYKNFSLYAFFEGKFGGSIITDTNSRMKQLGRHAVTVPDGGREAGFIPDGIMDDGSAIQKVVGSGDIQKYWTTAGRFDIGEENVYTNDFVRISQLSLSYRFPQQVLQGTFIKSANVALVGNNLGFVFKDVPNIDPEAYNRQNTNGQGVEGIGMPIGESLGLSINLKL
ncbi:TonB-dependent receptor, partial [Flavobacteriaceae bacterium]|nr:TonB-dependent receptor [Flavobacteriaceae bacterium]